MKTLAIASIVVAASCGGVAAQAQRLDDRQIAMAPGSTATTYGTTVGTSYGAPSFGGQAALQAAPPVMQQPPLTPPMSPPTMQRVPVPPSGVPSGSIPPAPGMQRGQNWGGQQLGGQNSGGQHWGGSIGGHWSGGMQAPGGWQAYRRPNRGFLLPSYWTAPSFFIVDFTGYGLTTPPYGYRWMRYYDDAVLVDGDGRVWDSVRGIDWNRGQDYRDERDYADNGYQRRDDMYDRRDGPGAGYPPPGAYPPPPPPLSAAPMIERYAGQQGYSRTYVAGGTYAGGYWYPPAVTTTITVESAPVITTTTTEYIETSSYRARRVYRAPKRRVIHRKACNCGCGCGS